MLHSAIEEERERLFTNEADLMSTAASSSAAESGSTEFQAFLESKLSDHQMTNTRAMLRSRHQEFKAHKKQKR